MATNRDQEDEKQKEELEKFLGKVDEIESIMKGLASSNSKNQDRAMEAADKFLNKNQLLSSKTSEEDLEANSGIKIGFDKTSINKECASTVSPDDFLKEVEEDARRRAEERKQKDAKAAKLKEQGNVAFKERRFNEAVQLYSDAISEVHNNSALFTNRAQALIKLGMWDLAYNDCEMALEVDKKCVKAFVHKGRALQGQGRFDEAILVFKEGTRIAPKQEKVFKDYISRAEIECKKAMDEKEVESLVSGKSEVALKVLDLTNKLKTIGMSSEAYTEAAKLLVPLLQTSVGKTAFRTSGGFQILKNSRFCRFWNSSEVCVETEDIGFVCEVVRALTAACTDNDCNVQEFLQNASSACFSQLLQDPTPPVIRSTVTSMLHQFSQTKQGRTGLLQLLHFEGVVQSLLMLADRGTNTSVIAMSTINNLALEQEFIKKHSTLISKDFFHVIQRLLLRLCKVCSKGLGDMTDSWALATSGLSAVANMTREHKMRRKVAEDKNWWDASIKFMDRYAHCTASESKVRSTICALLGLLANISSIPTENEKNAAPQLLDYLSQLISAGQEDTTEASTAVLRYLLSHSPEALSAACNRKLYVQFIHMLKSSRESTRSYAIKCLVLCTISHKLAREAVIKENGHIALVQLINSKDEVVIGNAALCLSHCVADSKESCQQLADTEIVQILLKHATDENLCADAKKNTAICLAKLATGDSRHLERLRELHGLEILHSVIQSTGID